MKVPIENAPTLIEFCRGMALRYRQYHDAYLEKAEVEADPEMRSLWTEAAAGELEIATAAESDADHLQEQLEAIGGTCHRRQ